MSGQKDREKRREERIAAESQAASGDRRTRLLQLAAGGVFLAIIVVVVVIIVAGGSSKSGGDASNLTETTQVDKLLTGIPQNGTVRGPSVPDLQRVFGRNPPGDHRKAGQKRRSQDRLPRLHHHQRRIDPGR
jgi:hypothetical protein